MRPWVVFGMLLASLACQLVGLVMFAKGFFPYKAISTAFASLEDLPPLPSLTQERQTRQGSEHGQGGYEHGYLVRPRFGKVVLMLVDALRSDFLYGNDSDFVFMQSLIDSHKAIPFTALASAPTVTLPRLKALTTGTVPGFLDAILNIAESDQSSTLANQDNWIAQMTRSASLRTKAEMANKQAVPAAPGAVHKSEFNSGNDSIQGRSVGFFGDDTWIKLFPGLFYRSEGTSSFFAMDTVEVDNNVTRHIQPELTRNDWDGLIFHYLGLDHVGHSGGPKSTLMRPKQAEMDAIAETIYRSLIVKDSQSASQGEEGLPTLFILCGDHGMNEVGNHGGSSRSEISTAFLFMSSLFEKEQVQAEIQAFVDPYRHTQDREEYQYYRSVRQVDLVPTLSLLTGLPIPKNSVGKLIPELFSDLTEMEYLRALQINAHQVAGVLRSMWPDFEMDSSVLLQDYILEIDLLISEGGAQGHRCSKEKSQKSRLVCWYGVALAGHASFLSMAEGGGAGYASQERTLRYQVSKEAYTQFLEGASSMLSTALSTYDMPLLTNGSLMMAFAVAGFIYCALQTSLVEDFTASCLEPLVERVSLVQSSSWRTKLSSRHMERKRNDVNWIMARVLSFLILILYVVTLFASSFVEEEHQFWYYFSMTWWAVLGLTSARYLDTPGITLYARGKREGEGVTGCWARGQMTSSVAAAGYSVFQMVMLRLQRSWNQTGQKYADQIDMRHYLNATWLGFSWVLFWVSLVTVAASMVMLVLSANSPFELQRQSGAQRQGSQNGTIAAIRKVPKAVHPPAWKAGIIAIVQALLTVLVILVSLWIGIYKMDLESGYFGALVMGRVHTAMSSLSSVGYSTTQGTLTMSGYAMARGSYAGLGAMVVLGSVLSWISSPASSRPICAISPSSTQTAEDRAAHLEMQGSTRAMFGPFMLQGMATLLLILLSRRHNAPLFVLFGVQLLMYLKWISLVRHRSTATEEQDLGEQQERGSIVRIGQDRLDTATTVETASTRSSSLAPGATSSAMTAEPFRTLPGLSSIHSCTSLLWTLSSFFLLGNSNSIASIDISNAYVGIQAYDIFFTGVLTFISNWAGPIWWCLATMVVMRWDVDAEISWARQNKLLWVEREEEDAWRTISRWWRADKTTWTRKTKRRQQLYKRTVAKYREAGEAQQLDREGGPVQAANVMELQSPAVRGGSQMTDALAESIAGSDSNSEMSGQEHQHDQEEEGAYLEGEDDDEADTLGEDPSTLSSSLSTIPCVFTDYPAYRKHLIQTRILDHLILTSGFFAVVLYALSVAAIILRHHLFIWTVFSPKVLYQFAWTVLFQATVQVLFVGGGVWSIAWLSAAV